MHFHSRGVRIETLLIAAILLAGCAPASAGELYRNTKLGFSFVIPEGAVRCGPDRSTGPEHGTALWLDARGGECGSGQARPYVAVGGGFNSMFWANAKVALEHACTNGDLAKPPRLDIDRHPAAVCKVVRRDGWIEVHAEIMTGRWPPPYQSPEDDSPHMLYSIDLYTTPAREQEDLKRMRAIAKSLRLFEPK
jgi:hypothetical protein